jgi:hypothetical protein
MVCLGPSPTERCPDGALLPDRTDPRCRRCRAARAQATIASHPDLARLLPHRRRAHDAELLVRWREHVGPWCPGDPAYGDLPAHPAHHSADLTVHHPVALAAGGHPDQPGRRILCRARNSALGITLGDPDPDPSRLT